MRHGWGITVVTLGAWEAWALGTRRVPTITATVRACCDRWPRSRVAVVAWTFMLARHLAGPTH